MNRAAMKTVLINLITFYGSPAGEQNGQRISISEINNVGGVE